VYRFGKYLEDPISIILQYELMKENRLLKVTTGFLLFTMIVVAVIANRYAIAVTDRDEFFESVGGFEQLEELNTTCVMNRTEIVFNPFYLQVPIVAEAGEEILFIIADAYITLHITADWPNILLGVFAFFVLLWGFTQYQSPSCLRYCDGLREMQERGSNLMNGIFAPIHISLWCLIFDETEEILQDFLICLRIARSSQDVHLYSELGSFHHYSFYRLKHLSNAEFLLLRRYFFTFFYETVVLPEYGWMQWIYDADPCMCAFCCTCKKCWHQYMASRRGESTTIEPSLANNLGYTMQKRGSSAVVRGSLLDSDDTEVSKPLIPAKAKRRKETLVVDVKRPPTIPSRRKKPVIPSKKSRERKQRKKKRKQ